MDRHLVEDIATVVAAYAVRRFVQWIVAKDEHRQNMQELYYELNRAAPPTGGMGA